MGEFDWVTARANCSLAAVFEALRLGVKADTTIRSEIKGERFGFHFTSNGQAFSVLRAGAMPDELSLSHRVEFGIENKSIVVSMDGEKPFLQGTLALGDDGACRIRANGAELEFWQFRMRALEKLFFGF